MIDFLIIGGGIAGVSAASRLSEHGSVVLLEAESALAYHASGRSAAMYEKTYGKASTLTLNVASREHHMTAHGGVLSPRGLMMVGNADCRDAFDHDFSAMHLNEMSFEDAQKLVPILKPDAVTLIGHHDEAWDIDTNQLVSNFQHDAKANGAEIFTNHRVDGIHKTSKGWRVSAGSRDFECAVVINASGPWVNQIAEMAGVVSPGFTPLRRSMARLAAPGGLDVSGWPMIYGAGETWYAKPDAGSLIVSPAEETVVEPHDAWADEMILAEGLERYQANVIEPVTRPQASWAGIRTFSPDRSLVIGFDPMNSSFFWLAGQGGYGFQSCPAASQLAADLIAGRPSELDAATVAAVSPARFS